jgi:hypothetical protein
MQVLFSTFPTPCLVLFSLLTRSPNLWLVSKIEIVFYGVTNSMRDMILFSERESQYFDNIFIGLGIIKGKKVHDMGSYTSKTTSRMVTCCWLALGLSMDFLFMTINDGTNTCYNCLIVNRDMWRFVGIMSTPHDMLG